MQSFFWFYASGLILIPFSTSPDSGGVITYGTPFLMIAAIVSLLEFKIDRILTSKAVFIATLYTIFMVMTAFISPWFIQSAARVFYQLIGYSIFLGLLSFLQKNALSHDKLIRVVIVSCAILASYYLLNLLFVANANGLSSVVVERYVGGAMSLPWGASNTIAQVLLLSFCFFTMLEHKKVVDIILVTIVGLGIFFTFSRSVIFLMVLICFIVLGWKRLGLLSVTVVCLFFLAYFLIPVTWSDFDVLLNDRFDPESLYTGNSRISEMTEKFFYFIENPFKPVGYYGSLYYFDQTAHNYWITTLVEQSLFGFVFSIYFFLYFIRRAFLQGPLVGKSFLVVVIGLCVEDPHFTQQYIVLFWVLLAFLSCKNKKLQGETYAV